MFDPLDLVPLAVIIVAILIAVALVQGERQLRAKMRRDLAEWRSRGLAAIAENAMLNRTVTELEERLQDAEPKAEKWDAWVQKRDGHKKGRKAPAPLLDKKA